MSNMIDRFHATFRTDGDDVTTSGPRPVMYGSCPISGMEECAMAQHHALEELSVPVAGTHVVDERVRVSGRPVDEDIWILHSDRRQL